ncbi:TerB family tellurite resistance protein [Nocardia sp. CA-135953]|uniref:TerB family tellurite resistance protein n=1 Tax=Nocardia sp. CA-135953 TaxID=3239978 RepID=UPI003D960D4A
MFPTRRIWRSAGPGRGHDGAHVLQQIAKAAGKQTEAHAVVQIGIMIGNADGNFDQNEIAAVREACQTLGVDPQQFGI